MSASSTIEPGSGFVCDCAEEMRSACNGEPFYKEHENKRYCVLHLPSKEKSTDFEKALQRKLNRKDFNFAGVWFPNEVMFHQFHFSADTNFSCASFSAEADFSSVIFYEKANFQSAIFYANVEFDSSIFRSDAIFASAKFMAAASYRFTVFEGPVFFTYARFGANADFAKSTFGETANAYFNCVTFRRAGFGSATFNGTAHFTSSTFKAPAHFRSTIFGAAAYFSDATFCAEADFEDATFKALALFSSATFNALANFNLATFVSRVDHSHASFMDYARFAGREGWSPFGDQACLDFQFARMKNPEHVSFHTLPLRPHWFVNVDAHKFEFINVFWGPPSIGAEIRSLENKKVSPRHSLLAIAFRHLAANAEDSHRYEEASKFRYLAMDALRLEKERALWSLSWWYWLASGYGERVWRAFLVLLAILLLSAVLYNHVGFARWEPRLASESDVTSVKRDDVGAPLKFSRALTYSAAVMAFQRPEPRPATIAAQTLVLLETILGPVQAALLALAIRRKFMR